MSERLVDFLYILARDHLPTGVLEGIMWDQVDSGQSSYCNDHLEAYARNLAERLTDDSVPLVDWKHMYRSADAQERYYIGIDGTKVDAPYEERRSAGRVEKTYGSPRHK